jgi:UDPglucose--hexose-1-phosphate uridylyltransferase
MKSPESEPMREPLEMFNKPHRRYNPLRDEWVLVSPQRTQRPWQGETGTPPKIVTTKYDAECYLCPGNHRANGEVNPAYENTFAFTNDFSALMPETPLLAETESPLLVAESVRGVCRVLCFDPDHSLTLARMSEAGVQRIVAAWQHEYLELSKLDWIRHVQIFENRGTMMGASNPHPHGQIWATGFVPDEVTREERMQAEYLRKHGKCLLCEYLQLELQRRERIVCGNEEFVALVPWWAIWPFETLVLPVHHAATMLEFSEAQATGLADILKQLTVRYDNLFQTSFPYTMGFHQGVMHAGETNAAHHFHAHFYPPLLRSAEVRKFMVGFEMLDMPQRDLTTEMAAERLRAVDANHYMLAAK